jgi:hypothetical protein
MDKSKTRAENPSSLSFQHSAFSIHTSDFLSPVSCPLSPKKEIGKNSPQKTPVFSMNSTSDLLQTTEKPQNPLVKPEGKNPLP